MTPRNFLYLAVAAGLSVLFAVVSYASNNQWGAAKLAGGKLFPSLADNISRVAGIEVERSGEKLTLEKTNALWGVKDRGGYPVDFSKVRTLLVGLSEADLVEGKTRRPDRYAALELEDPAAKGAKSTLVRLTGEKGDVLAEVVIGKKRQETFNATKSGTYVRRPGNAQTWLTDVELNASLSTKEWMKTAILSLDAGKIDRMTIEIPGEQPLKVERQGGAEGKLALVSFPPEGKKLKDAGVAETIARAVASIDLEDVRKLDGTPKGQPAGTVRIEGKDLPSIALQVRKEGEIYWLSLTATGDGEAKKAADEISGRTKGWDYKIAEIEATSFLKKRSDLLEPPPAPAEPKK